MNRSPAPPVHGSRRPVVRVLVEAAIVALAGVLLGFVGNTLSPRGLRLTRDYFPAASTVPPATSVAPVAPVTLVTPPTAPTTTNSPTPAEVSSPLPTSPSGTAFAELEQRLQARGLRLGLHEEVETLFRDPRHESEQIIFVDARKDERFAAGHIPGAYAFDHYYPEKYLPDLLPACQTAEWVIVYCTGGHCEDSEFAAVQLRDAGVPPEKLIVYGGGIDEWSARKLPVEIGQRRSGQLLPQAP